MTVPAVPDRVCLICGKAPDEHYCNPAHLRESNEQRAEAMEASFRRRTLDEVYGYDASTIPSHAISPARLAGV